jgi:hypothetical protein
LLTGSAGTKFLQGGVQHSEQLAPVQSGLKVGATFDAANLEQGTASRIWYRVPPWMVGNWQDDDYTNTSTQDYQTGTINSQAKTYAQHSTGSWGRQRDRLGGIWSWIDLPASGEESTDTEIDKDYHTDDSIIFDSDTKLIRRYVYTRTAVSKATNTIRSVSQYECFTTYTMYGDKMKSEYSMKEFDDRGKPKNLTKGWSIGHKIEPFTAHNFDLKKQDVRPSFREYLKSQGLDNLVPVAE